MLLSPVCEVAGERRRFLFYLIEDETLFQPLGVASRVFISLFTLLRIPVLLLYLIRLTFL